MLKQGKLLLFLAGWYSGLLLAQPNHSAVEPLPLFSKLRQGHAFLQLGGYWGIQGKAQHINIINLIGDDFTLTKHQGSNGLVGAGYFIDGKAFSPLRFSYGINAFYLPKTSVSGIVVQEETFSNLSYSYHIRHYPVYATLKAEKDFFKNCLTLTLDAGIGPNFMQAA